MKPDAAAAWPRPAPYDFFETTRLLRTGPRDPTMQREPDGFWRTAHTVDGPVTVRVSIGDALRADAWGPGADTVMSAVPRWLGLHEDQWRLPSHPVTDLLLRAHGGLRSTDTCDVFEALMHTVLHQLITWDEAAINWRRICLALGDPAPGPVPLRLSPTPRAIRAAGTLPLEAAGVGGRQARTLVEVARVARALRRVADLPTHEAAALLHTVRGIGPWTSATALGMRLGRPEPIPVGDFHLPNTVAWALAGEPRADDASMVTLLEPFGGQAFRVIRLITAARIEAPKRGPRFAWRQHRRR